jgi:hypothetical protein
VIIGHATALGCRRHSAAVEYTPEASTSPYDPVCLSIRNPRLHNAASAARFAYHNPFVIRPVLDEQPFVGLVGVVELQREEVLGIGKLLGNER